MENENKDDLQSPGEMYLLELTGPSRQKASAVIAVVSSFQGYTDWRQAQWQRITAEDLPGILAKLQATFADPADVKNAIGTIKGVARCAWRQKVISGQQLAVISKWKGA
ncbi:MAG TPA: hypothetical protein VGK87_17840 [Anaerolineae bacterium]